MNVSLAKQNSYTDPFPARMITMYWEAAGGIYGGHFDDAGALMQC